MGVLVSAWAWGGAFWRWKDRSSPPDQAEPPEHPQRHLALVAASASDGVAGPYEEAGASEDTSTTGSSNGLLGAVVFGADAKTLDHSTQQTEGELVLEEERASARTSSDESANGYLLLIPTPHGYDLLEQDGCAPAVLDDVSLPGGDGVFFVSKVGASPLPGDDRVCAFLEPR